MWSNLLSGTIGAIIGVVGAFVAAAYTVRLSRREESQQSRAEFALRVSGDLAAHLVDVYDVLRRIEPDARQDEQPVALETLHGPAAALRRAITVDAPMLPGDLEAMLKVVRKMINEIVPREGSRATAGELRRLLDAIRPAGDRLRDLRRDWYQAAPHGMKLG